MRMIQDIILQNKSKIISVLCKHETWKTAVSEIEKCLSCLANVNKQLLYLLKPKLGSLCVFLPLNQPLYSLLLFVIIPSCRFDDVYFRPPKLLSDIYRELYDILDLVNYNIYCDIVSRSLFVKEKASNSDCVIYTGRYDNAIEIKRHIPHKAIFIFQGSATNPIIITNKAIITEQTIDKIIKAQIYNSGQDCMAPSAIFVSEEHRDCFLKLLIKKVSQLVVGEYDEEDTDISRLLERETVRCAERLMASEDIELLYGGKVDYKAQIVYPSIIEYKNLGGVPSEASFAPIFSIYIYKSEQEIVEYLTRKDCLDNRAYMSIFGQFIPWNGDEIIIQDDIMDSVDDGNTEFGGFGIHSGFVSYGGFTLAKPILISKELAMFSRINNHVVPEGDIESPAFESYIVSSLVDLKKRNILEMGCGVLPHAKYLASRYNSYYALDLDEDKIASANRMANRFFVNTNCMDACNTDYKSSSFSIVLMFHFLHEVTLIDQGKVLKEVLRILDRDGLLLMIDTVYDRTTEFQGCFDIVHEGFFDYKHAFGVEHAEWIVNEYIKRGLFDEVCNIRVGMNYHFSSLDELCDAIIDSFAYEMIWDSDKRKYLDHALQIKVGTRADYNLEEEISVRLLKKHSS